MKIKAIINGAAGRVGEGVWLECLKHPDGEQVLVLNRKPGGGSYAKRREIRPTDFLKGAPCEGSSGAVMEAMASGLPVVTTPNSGTVARDGVEGFIAPCHDVSRFTEAITRLADEPELRHTMGLAARRRAEEFSLESYSRQLYRLFSQLVQAPERSPASR